MTISVNRRTVNQPQVGDKLTLIGDEINLTKVPKCVAEDEFKVDRCKFRLFGNEI